MKFSRMPSKYELALLLSLLLIVTVTVYIFKPSEQSGEKNYSWEAAFGAIPLKNNEAPNFTLKSLQGGNVSLKDFKGKVVLINFWATWCYSCIIEMPSMEKIYNKYKNEGFVILGVDIMEPEERVRKFIQKNGYTFPILLDPEGSLRKDYPMTGIPTSYLVDKNGNLKSKILGAREWDDPETEKNIIELLDKNGS